MAAAKNALLALASCALVLLLAEAVVRLLPPRALGFVYRDGTFAWPREYQVSPEAAARRNERHFYEPGPKPPGVERVVLLGDSFVEGLMVSDPDTVGARLEHYLNAAGSRRFEVVAWGSAGWGPEQEFAWLRKHGRAAHPDLVVTLFLVLNDISCCSPELNRIHREQEDLVPIRLLRGNLPAERLPLFFLEGSLLNQLISYRLLLLQAGRSVREIPVDYFVYQPEEDRIWREARQRSERALLATRSFARSLGARYAIVSAATAHGVLGPADGLELLMRSYPAMRRLEWDLDAPERRLAAFCAEHEIPFLGLEPGFREAVREGGRFHWEYDGHWNPAGNDLAGRWMADFLLGLELGSRNQETSGSGAPSRAAGGSPGLGRSARLFR